MSDISTNGILVLVYHSYHPYFPQSFESHIQYLKNHCQILSSDDFCDAVTLKKEIPNQSVLITLDDGFHTDYTIAYPILKAHQAHAVSFVITDPYYTDISGKAWWKEVGGMMEIGSHTVSHAEIFVSDELTGFIIPVDGQITKMYCMVKGVDYQPGFPLYQRGPELVNRQVAPPAELITAIGEAVKGFDFFEKKDWYETLKDIVRRSPSPYRYETDEARRGRIQQEILGSKNEIEKITGKRCRVFAYPWGVHNEEVIQCVKAVGYQFAFTATEGLVFMESDPFTINRVNVPLESSEVSIEDIVKRFFK
jgi:peptidoglycan/xylan/chitin deacetylase (PgdA/CDA1 family)